MSSKTFYGLMLSLLSLVLLFALVIPFYSQQIEFALENNIKDQVKGNGFNWTNIEAKGRDLTLRGEAPTPTAYDKVLELAYNIPGVRTITNLMTQRTISPYTASLDWNDNTLVVAGFLPDESSQRAIKRQINLTYMNKTIKQLDIGHGSPAGWTEIFKVLLEHLPNFEHVSIDLVDKKLSLSGKISSSQHSEQLLQALAPFKSSGYTLGLHIIANDEKARDCQKTFDGLMNESISFNLGEDQLNKESFALLERLAETAMFCPEEIVTVAGHADNEGSEKVNQALSEQRAVRVAGWLTRAGIDEHRIRTIGHGSLKPIADNNTKEGRSINRRIEFIVGEQ